MASKTIVLMGKGIRKERPAAAAGIRPGDLVEVDVNGDFAVHSTALGSAQRSFVVENELEGKGIDDNYLDNEQVHVEACHPGMEVLAWLLQDEVAVIGSFLDSVGAGGNLKIVDTAAATADISRNSLVGIALEALTATGSDKRIRIEVM